MVRGGGSAYLCGSRGDRAIVAISRREMRLSHSSSSSLSFPLFIRDLSNIHILSTSLSVVGFHLHASLGLSRIVLQVSSSSSLLSPILFLSTQYTSRISSRLSIFVVVFPLKMMLRTGETTQYPKELRYCRASGTTCMARDGTVSTKIM